MANDQISIKVNIGDRIYPLKIQANEEEYVRKAAKILNDKMGFFNSNFIMLFQQHVFYNLDQ